MNALESRYRAALGWYPLTWRTKNEDAVVGTLMDLAESDGRSRPGRLELANLRIHGLAERVRLLPSAVPPELRDRTATAALAVGSAIAVSAVMQLETTPSRVFGAFGFERPTTFGPFASPMIVVYLTWIVALFAATAGRAGVARWMTLATIPLTIAARLVADATGMFLRPTSTFLGILILLALLVFAGAPAPGRVGAGLTWLLIWFLPALVLFTLPQTLMGRGAIAFQVPIWLDRPTLLAWSSVIAVAIAAALSLVRLRWWPATVLLVGLPFVVASLFGLSRMVTQMAGWLALLSFTAVLGVVLFRSLGFRIELRLVTSRGERSVHSDGNQRYDT